MDFTSMIQGARLPRLPKAKTDCALGTEWPFEKFSVSYNSMPPSDIKCIVILMYLKSPIMETFST